MPIQTAYHYRDISLQPEYSTLNSRAEAVTRIKFGKYTFNIPIVPANMKTVINQELAIWLAERGYFYVMHRFGVNPLEFCQSMQDRNCYTSISLGVNQDSIAHVKELANAGIQPDYITVDIAHGHCNKMEKMAGIIKQHLPDSFLILGNVCTPEGVVFLEKLGANFTKVGIGPGSACTTKLKTGFTCPQFTAVLECAKVAKVPIIADGGVEYPGDIAKALVAGASMVMAGKLFAGHEESPGEKKILPSGQAVFEYYGSASEHNKGEKKHVEGRRIEIPYKGPIQSTLDDLTQSLRSSISYAGGCDLSAFNNVKWVVNNS